MRKTPFITYLVLIGSAILFVLYLDAISPVAWFSSSSPERTYKVELSGNESRPLLPLLGQTVRFELYQNEQKTISKEYLISFNWEDLGYGQSFRNHFWPNESVIRFIRGVPDRDNEPDILVVSNKTDRQVKYINIAAWDVFLIFDLMPNETIELQIPYSKWHAWISASGGFIDGSEIKSRGVNFNHKGALNAPPQYCVSITENGFIISSTTIEGKSSDELIVPRKNTCAD